MGLSFTLYSFSEVQMRRMRLEKLPGLDTPATLLAADSAKKWKIVNNYRLYHASYGKTICTGGEKILIPEQVFPVRLQASVSTYSQIGSKSCTIGLHKYRLIYE